MPPKHGTMIKSMIDFPENHESIINCNFVWSMGGDFGHQNFLIEPHVLSKFIWCARLIEMVEKNLIFYKIIDIEFKIIVVIIKKKKTLNSEYKNYSHI